MTEFVRGYVLPDLGRPQPEDLLSLLLVWDEIEVEAWDGESAPSNESQVFRELKEAGLVREYQPFIKMDTFVDPTIPDNESNAELLTRAEENGLMLADGLITSVSKARREATDRGAAPLAVTYFAELASALPPLEPSAPIAEASMIQVATQGIRVNRDTAVKDVLRFRERNRRLMGRFRGALVDLAASIDTDTATQATEQAHAKLVNRVEPELGNLTTALARGSISFTTETLVGATAVSLAPIDPATMMVAGGALAARTLKYAFDRDRIVKEHPLGLVYRARQQFGEPSTPTQTVVSDPDALIRDLCTIRMVQFHRDLRGDTQASPQPHS